MRKSFLAPSRRVLDSLNAVSAEASLSKVKRTRADTAAKVKRTRGCLKGRRNSGGNDKERKRKRKKEKGERKRVTGGRFKSILKIPEASSPGLRPVAKVGHGARQL